VCDVAVGAAYCGRSQLPVRCVVFCYRGMLSWNTLITALGWQVIRSCSRKRILKRWEKAL
jgi:hypothetical protein